MHIVTIFKKNDQLLWLSPQRLLELTRQHSKVFKPTPGCCAWISEITERKTAERFMKRKKVSLEIKSVLIWFDIWHTSNISPYNLLLTFVQRFSEETHASPVKQNFFLYYLQLFSYFKHLTKKSHIPQMSACEKENRWRVCLLCKDQITFNQHARGKKFPPPHANLCK